MRKYALRGEFMHRIGFGNVARGGGLGDLGIRMARWAIIMRTE